MRRVCQHPLEGASLVGRRLRALASCLFSTASELLDGESCPEVRAVRRLGKSLADFTIDTDEPEEVADQRIVHCRRGDLLPLTLAVYFSKLDKVFRALGSYRP